MANIFSKFGTKVGNAFTNRGQGGNLFNADPSQIANLSEEDKRRLQREGLERFANSIGVAAAIGSGDPQRIAMAQNKMRQAKIDKENAKAKANLKKIIQNSDSIPDSMKEIATAFPDIALKSIFNKSGGRTSTADIDNFNFYQSLPADQKKIYLQLKRLDEESIEGLESAKKKGQQGGVVVPPLQMKMDEAFANDAVEYLSGGQAQVEANINNLKDKIRILESGELNVSGPIIGNTPEFAQSFANPAALSFIGDIRDIVFQSLREKLGAQFTEKEGDRLVAAAFDQRLPEAENVKRLQRLLKTIEGAASSKEDMIAHYRKNKTLDGYEQKALTFDSLFDSMVTSDFSNKTDEELRAIYNNGDEATKNAVIRFLEKREK